MRCCQSNLALQFSIQRELVVTEFVIKDSIHLSRRGDVGLSTCYATCPFDLAGFCRVWRELILISCLSLRWMNFIYSGLSFLVVVSLLAFK